MSEDERVLEFLKNCPSILKAIVGERGSLHIDPAVVSKSKQFEHYSTEAEKIVRRENGK